MNPQFLDRDVGSNQSYSVRHVRDSYLMKLYHYHKELEIVAIIQSKGTRFVGDNISEFGPGEIVVIGQNIPHMWQNSKEHFEPDTNKQAEAIAIHLSDTLMSAHSNELPEMAGIRRLYKRALRGVLYRNNRDIYAKILTLPNLEGFERYLTLINIMDELGTTRQREYLNSEGYAINQSGKYVDNRLFTIHKFIKDNFHRNITLNEVSSIVNMNASSFSRYFKKHHRIPLVQYINNIRVGFACKLLLDESKNIAAICFESGFQNLSNFNRQFKSRHNMSPKEYRQQFDQTID